MPPIDEQAARKPGFQSGIAVELADGQKYFLPPMKVRLYPHIEDDGTIISLGRPVYADQLEEELDILFGVVPSEPIDSWTARFKIAVHLLKSNYDLDNKDVSRLLSYVPGDPASEARWDVIREAILGREPDRDEGEDPKGDTPSGSD